MKKKETDNDKRLIRNKYYTCATKVRCFVGMVVPNLPSQGWIPGSLSLLLLLTMTFMEFQKGENQAGTVSPLNSPNWTELLKKLESGRGR